MEDGLTGIVQLRPLGRAGDLDWVVRAQGEVYAGEFGWDPTFGAEVARMVADYADPADDGRPRGAWIAAAGDERVGCVFCVPGDGDGDGNRDGEDDGVARLELLLVHSRGRGRGVGVRLVEAGVDFARAAGYRTLRVSTYDVLSAARVIYLDAGFVLTGSRPRHRFGAELVEQTYELDLGAAGSSERVSTR